MTKNSTKNENVKFSKSSENLMQRHMVRFGKCTDICLCKTTTFLLCIDIWNYRQRLSAGKKIHHSANVYVYDPGIICFSIVSRTYFTFWHMITMEHLHIEANAQLSGCCMIAGDLNAPTQRWLTGSHRSLVIKSAIFMLFARDKCRKLDCWF